MWLSGVVEEPEEQQICLENVLVINPQNDKARRGLDFVSTKTGIPPHLPPDPNSADISASELTSPLKWTPRCMVSYRAMLRHGAMGPISR